MSVDAHPPDGRKNPVPGLSPARRCHECFGLYYLCEGVH